MRQRRYGINSWICRNVKKFLEEMLIVLEAASNAFWTRKGEL